MTDKSAQDWGPDHISDDYLSWSIPSQCWSGEGYGEDMLKVWYQCQSGEWHACTEMDQNVKRDLDDDEVSHVREEFGLDRYVEKYAPQRLTAAP